MAAQRPRRPELRPRREEQQHRRGGALIDQQLVQLERRGVDPVQILEHDHQRLQARVADRQRRQGAEQPLARHLRCGEHRRVAGGHRDVEQRSQQRQRRLGIEAGHLERARQHGRAHLVGVLRTPGEELLRAAG